MNLTRIPGYTPSVTFETPVPEPTKTSVVGKPVTSGVEKATGVYLDSYTSVNTGVNSKLVAAALE